MTWSSSGFASVRSVAHAVLLLNLRLRRLDLLARLRELRGQEGDSAAFDAGLARGFDGGRGFVQALFKERILGARQQPLVNLGQSGARIGIRGIARLQLQVEFQRIVARRFGQAIRRQRRRGARQQGRFNRGGFRGFARGGAARALRRCFDALSTQCRRRSAARRWRRRSATRGSAGDADLRGGVSAARRR